MKRLLPLILWLGICGHLIAGGLAKPVNALVPVTGTHVLMTQPAGFAVAYHFPGFAQKATYSSVMVMELPAPFAQATAGFNKPMLAGRGITLLSLETRSLDGAAAFLLHVTQKAAGITFEKWIYTFGDAQQTVLVTATFPQPLAATLSGPLKAAVLSARWERAKTVDPFADLHFRVTASPPFQFKDRVGNTLLFMKSGITAPDPAMFAAGYALADFAPADPKQFAMQRLTQYPMMTQTVISTNAVVIDGLKGYESIATGVDKHNVAVTLYQVMLFQNKTYFLMFGLTPSSQADQDIPLFRSTANSLQTK